jgi:capsule polysaccharide export protein KpsE/RkpR
MRHPIEQTGSDRAYAAAHAAHYSERNLAAALQLYMELIASRPNAPEAGYSRAQIQNIINAVVPAQELLDAQIELALARLDCREPT